MNSLAINVIAPTGQKLQKLWLSGCKKPGKYIRIYRIGESMHNKPTTQPRKNAGRLKLSLILVQIAIAGDVIWPQNQ
jgi:hypothetical protein